jgi:hypothetical protein
MRDNSEHVATSFESMRASKKLGYIFVAYCYLRFVFGLQMWLCNACWATHVWHCSIGGSVDEAVGERAEFLPRL